jgi:hypothetical protein
MNFIHRARTAARHGELNPHAAEHSPIFFPCRPRWSPPGTVESSSEKPGCCFFVSLMRSEHSRLGNPARHDELKDYAQHVMHRFRNDRRIQVWDVFNSIAPTICPASLMPVAKLFIPPSPPISVTAPPLQEINARVVPLGVSEEPTASPWMLISNNVSVLIDGKGLAARIQIRDGRQPADINEDGGFARNPVLHIRARNPTTGRSCTACSAGGWEIAFERLRGSARIAFARGS